MIISSVFHKLRKLEIRGKKRHLVYHKTAGTYPSSIICSRYVMTGRQALITGLCLSPYSLPPQWSSG